MRSKRKFLLIDVIIDVKGLILNTPKLKDQDTVEFNIVLII